MRQTLFTLTFRIVFPFLALMPMHTSAQETGPRLKDIDKRPGYQEPLEKPHPMWAIEQARPDCFDPQTRATGNPPTACTS